MVRPFAPAARSRWLRIDCWRACRGSPYCYPKRYGWRTTHGYSAQVAARHDGVHVRFEYPAVRARTLDISHLLPILLVWLIWKLRYERKAFALQVLCGWAVLLICYFLLPAPPAPVSNPSAAVNSNYVYGPSDAGPQKWVHPQVWVGMLMLLFPVVFYCRRIWCWTSCSGEARRIEMAIAIHGTCRSSA
jgi:hypothetical protein